MDLDDYSFISRGFSVLQLDKPQTRDQRGNLLPFEANIQSADLVGITESEAAKTSILVVNPATGESAVIRLDPKCVDNVKGVVKVVLPFDGLFAFIQE